MERDELRQKTYSCPPFEDGGIKTPKWKEALVLLAEAIDEMEDADTYDLIHPSWYVEPLIAGVDLMNRAIREMLVERNGEKELYKHAFGLLLDEHSEAMGGLSNEDYEDLRAWCINRGDLAKRQFIAEWEDRQRRKREPTG